MVSATYRTSSGLIYIYLEFLRERILEKVKKKIKCLNNDYKFSKFYENYQPACLRNFTNPK